MTTIQDRLREHIAGGRKFEDHAEAADRIDALERALREAGDVIESYHKSTGVDLGDASRMPFYADTIAKIDAALGDE